MTRVAVIVGSSSPIPTGGIRRLAWSDRGAVTLAMARFGDDVVVYGADGEARCYARAAGAKSVGEFADSDNCSFDIALIGRGGCGERGDLMPALLAEQHGAALAYDVVDVDQDAHGFLVTRDLGRGVRDVLLIRDRVVLLIAESVARGPYVSHYRLNAARAQYGDYDARGEPPPLNWEPVTPRVRLGDHASRVAGRATDRMNALFGLSEANESAANIIRGSGETCARHLLRYLSRHGLIDRSPAASLETSTETSATAHPPLDSPDPGVTHTGGPPIRARRQPRRGNEIRGEKRGPLRIGADLDPENLQTEK